MGGVVLGGQVTYHIGVNDPYTVQVTPTQLIKAGRISTYRRSRWRERWVFPMTRTRAGSQVDA